VLRTKNIYLNGAYAATAFPFLLAKATNLSRQLRAAYDAALDKYDVLLTPTLPYIATSHAPDDATPLDQIAKQVGLTSNTCQFNQTGHPALTLPCGLLEIQEGPLAGSGVKLPVGLQLIGNTTSLYVPIIGTSVPILGTYLSLFRDIRVPF
jgi:amidase